MFILALTSATNGTREYFQAIRNVMGQPCAIGTDHLTEAKQFKTRAAAEKMHAKWAGAGVAMERFHVEQI